MLPQMNSEEVGRCQCSPFTHCC